MLTSMTWIILSKLTKKSKANAAFDIKLYKIATATIF